MTVRKAPRGLIFPIATAITDFNVTSTTITAPVKRGFFLGITTCDNSNSTIVIPTLTGWRFRLLHVATNGNNVAVWMGTPLLNLLTSASGTSLAYTNAGVNSTFTGVAFRQYDGSFKGDILDVAANSTTATSIAVAAPTSTMRAGKVIGLASCVFKSGGAGINNGSDAAMPDLGNGALGSVRLSAAPANSVPSSTTFSAGRSAGWAGSFLVMR